MEVISGKNLCKLIYETLSLIDARPIVHGERTSYIVYKMLQDIGNLEAYQRADLDVIVTLHDIGAYKTDNLNDSLKYESKNYMNHSVYGFLFLKTLSPYQELSKILLYHHTDARIAGSIKYSDPKIPLCLHLAEATDIYHKAMGPKFDLQMFNKYVDIKYSRQSLELINQAETKYQFLAKLNDGSYREELEAVRRYQIYSKEDTKKLLQVLIFCMGFRNELTSTDTLACASICKALAKKLTLSEEDANILYYAAVVHDIGMMSVPQKILSAPRKLTAEELAVVRKHVECTGQILNGKVKQKVIDIALAHHERFDGSGYPLHLNASGLNLAMAILQVADTVSALIGERSYRIKQGPGDVCRLLKEEASKGRLHGAVVDVLVRDYDEIMEYVRKKEEDMFRLYQKMEIQYRKTCGSGEAKS